MILQDELQAKMVLASRLARDKGEKRYFACGNHYHLSATDGNEEIAAS